MEVEAPFDLRGTMPPGEIIWLLASLLLKTATLRHKSSELRLTNYTYCFDGCVCAVKAPPPRRLEAAPSLVALSLGEALLATVGDPLLVEEGARELETAVAALEASRVPLLANGGHHLPLDLLRAGGACVCCTAPWSGDEDGEWGMEDGDRQDIT